MGILDLLAGGSTDGEDELEGSCLEEGHDYKYTGRKKTVKETRHGEEYTFSVYECRKCGDEKWGGGGDYEGSLL